MLVCCKAVRRGTSRALVSCDMPYGPAQQGPDAALAAAARLVEDGGADMIKVDAAAEFPRVVRALVREGIPVFAQFGLTPQTAGKYGIPYSAQNSPEAQATAEAAAKLVEEAKLLEDAGASLLDFTNSGPVAGAAVVAAVKIPVIGGFGGGPWLDGRVRLVHTAIGYGEKWLDSKTDTYTNTAKAALGAFRRADRRRPRRPSDQGLSKMPSVDIDGIATRYEIRGPELGSGPPLLMYAPGGFNATIEAWSTLGIYAKIKLLDHLPQKFTCIVFDRRECGQSGGRVEPITWMHFVAQGKGLLDHLGIARAHLMGGCMGCGPVAAFGVAHPHMVASMILFWPVGGYKYRLSSHKRFAEHLAFVRGEGLEAVVDLVQREGKPFGGDPRGGPWASVIKHDAGFRQVLRHARFGSLYSHLRDHARRAIRPRYRAGRSAGRPGPYRNTGPYPARPRRFACNLGGALSGRMLAAFGILGHAGRAAERGGDQCARLGVFG